MLGRAGLDAENALGVRREVEPGHHRALQQKQHEGRVELGGHLALVAARPQMRHLVGVRIVARLGRILVKGLADAKPDQFEVAITGSEVALDDVLERQRWVRELALARPPLLGERAVQAVLAAEVIRDQLLVDACAGRDLVDPSAGKALRGELRASGVEERGLRPFGIAASDARRWIAVRGRRAPSAYGTTLMARAYQTLSIRMVDKGRGGLQHGGHELSPRAR